jgi:GT2 family glycosyltransferase
MNYKDITAIIVTFKSEKVIFRCLDSITNIRHIIILDNSFDQSLKKKVLLKFPKIKFILSENNLGYGAANNVMLRKVKTKYAIILNPDTVILKGCISTLLNLSKKLENKFSIIAPSSKESEKDNDIINKKDKTFYEVDYVRGFAMFLNIIKIRNIGYFDENFFMYLEEIDLCKRLRNNNEKIFISTEAKCKHLGGKSSSIGFEFEINRNWHWMWSKLYYSSKHNGFLMARILAIPLLFKLISKILFYILFYNEKKLSILLARIRGLSVSFFNANSYFRPKLNVK